MKHESTLCNGNLRGAFKFPTDRSLENIMLIGRDSFALCVTPAGTKAGAEAETTESTLLLVEEVIGSISFSYSS